MKKFGIIVAAVFTMCVATTQAQQFSLAASPPGSGGASFAGFPPDDILYPGPAPSVFGAGVITGMFIDVNALCYGYAGIGAFSPAKVAHYEFSVSILVPGAGAAGAIVAEEAGGDHIADIYSSDGTGSNLLLWDGGVGPPPGTPLAGAFGVLEPAGDDVDAWDNNPIAGLFGSMYWCADAASAATIYGVTVSPADVLMTPPIAAYDAPFGGIGTPPGAAIPYAFAPMLGLDLLGPATDDIDALVVIDSAGDGLFTGVGGPDIILFSLTPGSLSLAGPSPYAPASPGDILFADSSGAFGTFLPASALGLTPAADLDALDIKIRQEGFMINSDTNGNVMTTWNDLVPPFSYTVEVASASAPYFSWTALGSFAAVGSFGTFIDTNATIRTGADDSGNYTSATFTNGSNAGTGFGPWSFVLSGASVIGLTNSTAAAGDIDSTNGLSFYLYGDTNGLYADLVRPLDAPLTEGDRIGLNVSYNYDGGNRGFDILDASSNGLLNVRVTPGNSLIYQFAGESNETVSTSYNGGTSVVSVAVTQLAGNQLHLDLNRNDGVTTNATSTLLSAPGAILKFYNGGHAGDNLAYALFVNDLSLDRGIKNRLFRTRQQPW